MLPVVNQRKGCFYFLPSFSCLVLVLGSRVAGKAVGNTMPVDCWANYVKLLLFCEVHFVIRRPN